MSQDLLSEFDSLYSPPAPPPAPPTANRRFTSAGPWDPWDPLNLNLGLPPQSSRPQLPLQLHNVPLARTASNHGHQSRPSATNFDDLLGIVNSPQAPWPPPLPRAPQLFASRLGQGQGNHHGGSGGGGSGGGGGQGQGQGQRPMSFHGVVPSSRIDMFAALGNDFSGSDGRGGRRFTPPPQQQQARGRPLSVATPPPPQDLLGLGDPDEDEEDEEEEDFGDFASAAPTPVLGPSASRSGSAFGFHSPNRAGPASGFHSPKRSGSSFGFHSPNRSGSGSASGFHSPKSPPRNSPVPAPPKPKYHHHHRHQKSLMDGDDDDFGDFMASHVTPQGLFGAPSAKPFSPAGISSPPRSSNSSRQTIALRTFASPPRAKQTPPQQQQIPPVAVLLTAFPPLFLIPQTHLMDKLATLPFPLRQRVLANARTKQFLEGICELGRVAGRIVAGRKRRGRTQQPRNAGGGMKLGAAGSANWEQVKEEREVKETCRLWADGAGRLKAAMGRGVPEIVDEGGVMRGGSGGGSGGGGCRLCGLGREEVVQALKERTEREGWWAEGWGHGGCKAFWGKFGGELAGK